MDEQHLIDMRRHLHRHPELSGYETETVAFIARELENLGIPFEIVEKGGVVGWIMGSGTKPDQDKTGQGKADPGKTGTVLLRADMDALPVQERKWNLKREKAVLSQTDGVSHVCGHDAHTAMLLSAAGILKTHRDRFSGTVYLCFERAEETCGPDQSYGYKPLLQYFDQKGLHPDSCLALHVRPTLESGHICAESGPAYAGSFGFSIRIKGRGGHGSRPDEANNPLDCFTAFYQALQSVPLRSLSPFEKITFSIPIVQMGEARNVIPDELYFAGTARGFEKNTLESFREIFYQYLDAHCKMYGCTYEEGLCWLEEPLINTEEDAQRVKRAAERIGDDVYRKTNPTLGSETFAHYTNKFGGAIAFLGIANSELGSGAPLHSPEFDLDESALKVGAQVLAFFALDALS